MASRTRAIREGAASVGSFIVPSQRLVSATAELLASLDGPSDPDAERTWEAEVGRRIASIEAGTMPSSHGMT